MIIVQMQAEQVDSETVAQMLAELELLPETDHQTAL
jgi:hypothetical protein